MWATCYTRAQIAGITDWNLNHVNPLAPEDLSYCTTKTSDYLTPVRKSDIHCCTLAWAHELSRPGQLAVDVPFTAAWSPSSSVRKILHLDSA